ncbi:PPOX class F420-dependent oxidoreductase [Natronobiforma cellulositropha]|uniref:PPOX class F420-dependent oxidoreductase n=1 Tax=Natronobiforma cellulositropha TaxID=1679076 RepID=UPI0021D5F822|nr:PPOX class F420-dependent oxidoreductase [Natronobiforma cellulositropha]
MEAIPAAFHDLFESDALAHFATVMPDGTPQVTPVWVGVDEEGHLLVNTARGRQKERNVERESSVGVSMVDPENPYRYLSVRGTVVEVTTEGAVEHIDSLAKRYMGVETYPYHDDDEGERVILRIRPDRVVADGG